MKNFVVQPPARNRQTIEIRDCIYPETSLLQQLTNLRGFKSLASSPLLIERPKSALSLRHEGDHLSAFGQGRIRAAQHSQWIGLVLQHIAEQHGIELAREGRESVRARS